MSLWDKPRVEAYRRSDVNKFLNFKKALWKDESGATAIEYGLLAALIAVAIIGAVTLLGGELNETFVSVEGDLNTANTGTPPPAD
jgi:pilus assembly protein Flp/PilA